MTLISYTRLVSILGLAILLAPTRAETRKNSVPSARETIKLWVDSPVRYLMTQKEYDDVGAISTVPELASFITAFWTRRDPTPGTLQNEYRRAYWGRVAEANHRFRDSTTPGWKTDRGRVFVLLGQPDEVRSEDHPAITGALEQTAVGRSSDSGRRGIERWTYRRRLSKKSRPEFVVVFVRDESLDWRLTDNADLQADYPGPSTLDGNNPAFGGLENSSAERSNTAAAANAPSATYGRGSGPAVRGANPVPSEEGTQPPSVAIVQNFQRDTPSEIMEAGGFPEIDTSVFANYDLGLETSVPSSAETAIATVSTREFIGGFASLPRFEFFRAQDGTTLVNVGSLIQAKDVYGSKRSGVSSLHLYASFVPVGGEGKPRYATNEDHPARVDLSEVAVPNDVIEVWTGLPLHPGRYQAILAVEDSLMGRLSRAAAEVDVPEFNESHLALSSLVLASSLSDTGGRLGVTARSSGTFRKSESFGVYFEVYGLAGSEPRFETTYRFYRIENGGPVRLGNPITLADRTEGAQGWSFPLSKWPAERYRLEVTATDVTGSSITAQTAFEVVE